MKILKSNSPSEQSYRKARVMIRKGNNPINEDQLEALKALPTFRALLEDGTYSIEEAPEVGESVPAAPPPPAAKVSRPQEKMSGEDQPARLAEAREALREIDESRRHALHENSELSRENSELRGRVSSLERTAQELRAAADSRLSELRSALGENETLASRVKALESERDQLAAKLKALEEKAKPAEKGAKREG